MNDAHKPSLNPGPTALVRHTGGTPASLDRYPEIGAGHHADLPEENEAAGWIEYFHTFRRRKATLAMAAVLGGIIGLIVMLPRTPIYQARATIEVQDNAESNLLRESGQSVASSVDSEINDIQTQIKIMTSDNLVSRVVVRMQKERHDDATSGGRPSLWRRIMRLPAPGAGASWQTAVGVARGTLAVREVGTTRIIEIFCDSTDPKIAAEFVNTLADEYIDQKVESRWQSSQRTAEKLNHALDDMRVKLERAGDSLQAYARESGLMFTDEKNSLSDTRLRDMQQALAAAQTDRIAKQSRYEIISATPLEKLSEVVSDTEVSGLGAKLVELRQQRAELATTFTPEYSKVKKIDAQLASLEAAAQKSVQAIRSRARSDYDEALKHERLITSSYQSQSRVVTQESEKKIHYDILKREVDSTRALYDTMLSRVKESGIATAIRASNVRIVDEAHVPADPYKPRVSQSVLVGTLMGLFLGGVFVVTRERADRSIQVPGDLNTFLNVPELGVVPSASVESRNALYYVKNGKEAIAGLKSAIAAPEDDKLKERVELVTWQRKPSMLAEAFRATLTSLLFSGKNGERPRVLVMTSANPSEGKTTITTNLAIAMAEIRQRVLLIDADMRRPRVHEIFGLEQGPGLSDALASSANLREGLPAGAVRPSGVASLDVLSSGNNCLAATNLLYSPRMEELLHWARREYDMVLIDTPPMLQIPDARVVGRVADAVILVVRAAKTTRDAAKAIRQRLAEDGTPVAGSILNDWNPKMAPGGYYGYYQGYNYRTSYYYGSQKKTGTDSK